MFKRSEQSRYRERLDKSLASAELQDQETVEALVRNQLQCNSDSEGFSDMMVARRTTEVSNILNLLRSVSTQNYTSKQSEWKLKEEKEEYRVMYRPGPEGSPLHSLLVDGFVDSPLDHCLCVTWESALYDKWWPQFSVPPFKVTRNEVLQKLRIGENLSLVRMKLPWPLSSREAVLHFFLFEYVKEDLILVVFNSISESDDYSESTDGFTKDCIPEVKDVVRIGVQGCSVLQKVSAVRTYSRTIANVDTKMNFFPPSLVNFLSRSVIAKGFKLFQKIASSVSKNDKHFSKALMDPIYKRIRSSLYEQITKGDANPELQSNVFQEGGKQIVVAHEHSSGACLNGNAELEGSSMENEIEDELFHDANNNGFALLQSSSSSEIEEVEEDNHGVPKIESNGRHTVVARLQENTTSA